MCVTPLEQIDKAIGAHGAWKVKLKQNIDGIPGLKNLPIFRSLSLASVKRLAEKAVFVAYLAGGVPNRRRS